MNVAVKLDRTANLSSAQDAFDRFRDSIREALAAGPLANDVIGKGMIIDGPFGPQRMIYADYAASGRALMQVEHFILEHVLPVYANPHTQASYCGRSINALRRVARQEIARSCGADDGDAVIFTGSGATAGIQKLVRLFGANTPDASGRPPLVLHGPYEHHSNILPWRESGAEVVELPAGYAGGVDLDALGTALRQAAGRHVICTFSAGSNVTGALTDIEAVTRLAKAHGALVIWDYAGAAPYVPMTMRIADDVRADAIVFSPHKLVGGPGAAGIMVVRRAAVMIDKPSAAGGGTVAFVSSDGHDYLSDVAAREEAGTPNVIADIRAALSVVVKDWLREAGLDERSSEMTRRALEAWCEDPRIDVLGCNQASRLPIVSFRVLDDEGRPVHHQLVTRVLSDAYGIQARGGCACAGPYVHRLLDIECDESRALRDQILRGNELDKPGFVRVNFSALMSDEECDFVIRSVIDLARRIGDYAPCYRGNPSTSVFEPIG